MKQTKQTYKQIEDEVVFDKGYMAPLYGSKKDLDITIKC